MSWPHRQRFRTAVCPSRRRFHWRRLRQGALQLPRIRWVPHVLSTGFATRIRPARVTVSGGLTDDI